MSVLNKDDIPVYRDMSTLGINFRILLNFKQCAQSKITIYCHIAGWLAICVDKINSLIVISIACQVA